MIEVWKPVRDNELYEVSNMGRVRRAKGGIQGATMHYVLKPCPTKKGYPQVVLRRDGKSKTFCVHKLVLEAFEGPCPEGMECCHGDGNPANNRVENLRWDTPGNNQLDRVEHGTSHRGEQNTQVKLTRKQAIEVRQLALAGELPQWQIANRYGTSRRHVSSIKQGKCWGWLFEREKNI